MSLSLITITITAHPSSNLHARANQELQMRLNRFRDIPGLTSATSTFHANRPGTLGSLSPRHDARRALSINLSSAPEPPTCLGRRRHGLCEQQQPSQHEHYRSRSWKLMHATPQWSRLLTRNPLSSGSSRKDAAKDPVRRLHRFEKEYSQLLVRLHRDIKLLGRTDALILL